MGAHDKLLELGLSVYEIQIVLEEHAHELAEELRAEKIQPPLEADGRLVNSVIETMARKIDPYVKGE